MPLFLTVVSFCYFEHVEIEMNECHGADLRGLVNDLLIFLDVIQSDGQASGLEIRRFGYHFPFSVTYAALLKLSFSPQIT